MDLKDTILSEIEMFAQTLFPATAKIPPTKILRKGGSYSCFAPQIWSKLLGGKTNEDRDQLAAQMTEALQLRLRDMYRVINHGRFVEFQPSDRLLDIAAGALQIKDAVITVEETEKKRVLVDYSSPNIAKDMHVGHLRSTIIGDSIANLLESLGHEVHRINHVGDFGTQFGMLLQQLEEEKTDPSEFTLEKLQPLYKAAKKRFKEDPDFKKRSLKKVVEFQAGDEKAVSLWQLICDVSRTGFEENYRRLRIGNLLEMGESFYQKMIPSMVDELKQKGLLVQEDGRWLFFVKGIKQPLTVVKSDGTYGYDATDLAAAKHRLEAMKMDRVIYVVDAGQSLHFRQVFGAVEAAGWRKAHQRLIHVDFGLVLGPDGKRLRSSSGDSYPLKSLLDLALLETKKKMIEADSNAVTAEELESNIPKIAYSAIKYSDLKSDRRKDYVFNPDQMLQLKGNTAVYLLYGYVRINSILTKAKNSLDESGKKINKRAEIRICENEKEAAYERNLLQQITLWPEMLAGIAEDLQLHTLCTYVYNLTVSFFRFYENCRCLHFDKEGNLIKIEESRLMLALLVQKILTHSFQILGLQSVPKM